MPCLVSFPEYLGDLDVDGGGGGDRGAGRQGLRGAVMNKMGTL